MTKHLVIFFKAVLSFLRYDVDDVHLTTTSTHTLMKQTSRITAHAWDNYVNGGGQLSRDAWRRDNVSGGSRGGGVRALNPSPLKG